jgi:hypothetical protein
MTFMPQYAESFSGQYLCPPTEYAPGSRQEPTTSSATMSAVSSANVNTGTFTAPASGNVLVTASFAADIGASSDLASFSLGTHGSVTPVCDDVTFGMPAYGTLYTPQFLVTGLTPGSTYNLDLLFSSPAGVALTLFVLGTESTTPSLAGAPVTMTVQQV